MKLAYCKGELIDLTNTKKPETIIKKIVAQHGATCVSCKNDVIFCSGPIKGTYFSHLKQNDKCEYYHESSNTKGKEEKLSPIMKSVVHPMERKLKRKLTKLQREQIYYWLYYDNYQTDEVLGAFAEIIEDKDLKNDLFKKMDSKLFAFTRGKKTNPYFVKKWKNNNVHGRTAGGKK